MKNIYLFFFRIGYFFFSNVNVNVIVKEIVRMATLSYYKDKFVETGEIDANMSISDLNISKNTIKFLKEKLCITDDVVRLKDIINITFDDLPDWSYRGGSNKKEINDLVSFCSDIYSILVNKNLNEECYSVNNKSVKPKYVKNRELLISIKNLEERYSVIEAKKLELEQEEQSIIDDIKKLKNELFEANSVDREINLKRKR